MLIEKAIRILREEGIKIFFKKSFRYFRNKFQFFLYPYFLFRIKKFHSIDINESIDFVFDKLFLVKPAQIPEEIFQLMKILKKIRPRTIVEIGTAKGGTFYLWTKVAASDAVLISVDLPGGPFGGGYPLWRIPFYESFAKNSQKVYLIRANSHAHETLEKVKKILKSRMVDFLFIDGDHTYEGVRRDFEMYSPLVANGGIIAFHDIVLHPPETFCEVHKFWKEIKHRYKHTEIVKNWNQGWAGIGMLYV